MEPLTMGRLHSREIIDYKSLISVWIFLSFCFLFICNYAWGDQAFLSTDPLPYFEEGYHLRGGIDLGVMRYSAMTVKSDRPLFTSSPQDNVNAVAKAVGADIDYIGKDSKGVYFGASFVRVRWIFQHEITGTRITRDGDLLGPRLGYRHYFKPWLFIDGRVNSLFNFESNRDVILSGTANKISKQYIYPFIEIGAAF